MATVTIQGTNYDVYQTDADVDAYLAATTHATNWQAALEDARRKVCVMASRIFNRTKWAGTPTAPGQALAFPRDGLTDRDGVALPAGSTPQGVLDGFSELCEQLLADPEVQNKSNTGSNISSVKAGSAAVTLFQPTSRTAPKFSPAVQEQVAPYLESGALGITVSGAGQSSAVSGKDYSFTGEGLP